MLNYALYNQQAQYQGQGQVNPASMTNGQLTQQSQLGQISPSTLGAVHNFAQLQNAQSNQIYGVTANNFQGHQDPRVRMMQVCLDD